jgi:putative ABC transport system permease protein
MAIPLAYNLRNLIVRRTTTIMTALGIALTVAVLLAVMALVAGLRATLSATGDPLQVLVIRKGAESELVSNFARERFQDLKFKAGIARTAGGQPMASLEVVTILSLARVDMPDGVNVNLRGISRVGIELRPGVTLAEGRWFQPGRREVVAGKSLANRFPSARLGGRIQFGRGDWDVVGVMDGGRGAPNSEIFADLDQVASDLQRSPVLSSALVRATDAVAAQALVNDINNDQRLNMDAMLEKDYYELQTRAGAPIEYIGIFVALVMAVGSSFAAMNTMYAAVARRAREIGTLRVLGFSRGAILLSFFIESVLLATLGGVLGCLMVLPLNGVTTAVGANFSELAFAFRVTPRIMLTGLGFAVLLGAAGGLLPARNAAHKEILTALREA